MRKFHITIPRVPSQYVENYVICGKSNNYNKKEIQKLTSDSNIDEYFQAAFQCGSMVMVIGTDEDLTEKAFEYAHEQVRKRIKTEY